jgi:hypothetical protein
MQAYALPSKLILGEPERLLPSEYTRAGRAEMLE